MSDYIFIADLFTENGILGGGELNNDECIKILLKRGKTVKKINSFHVSPAFVESSLKSNFIISNFLGLNRESLNLIKDKASYIIYEHDHKYLKTRNPSLFKDFLAPEDQIVNLEFYKNAKAILCQSSFHSNIVKKNIKTDNIINLGGNLWSEQILDFLEELSFVEKREMCSVMKSGNPIKNTYFCAKYCERKELNYELIPETSYKEFLQNLSKNNTFVFFPETAETLSRVVVECRMMGIKVITSKLIGATSEPWFKLKGKELINLIRHKRKEIVDVVQEVFKK